MATDASKIVATNVEGGNKDDVRDENTVKSKKGRGLSRDRTLEKRLVDVETVTTGLGVQIDDALQRLEGLDSDLQGTHEDFKATFDSFRTEVQLMIREAVKDAVSKLRKEMDELSTDTHRSFLGMEAKIIDCNRAIATAGGSIVSFTPRIEVPKPTPFMGKREARAVDDFLWEMERYFESVNIVDDPTKIKTVSVYLKDTAGLWWRRKHGEIERGMCTLNTWADFIRELKKQFYPENAENEARSRLRKLKQTGTIKDYVKEFTTLVLEIPDLSDKDFLFYFLDGLQPWAKTELERRGVQDLSSAIAVAQIYRCQYPPKCDTSGIRT